MPSVSHCNSVRARPVQHGDEQNTDTGTPLLTPLQSTHREGADPGTDRTSVPMHTLKLRSKRGGMGVDSISTCSARMCTWAGISNCFSVVSQGWSEMMSLKQLVQLVHGKHSER